MSALQSFDGVSRKDGQTLSFGIAKFSMCCGNGKVQLQFLKPPPSTLSRLLFVQESIESRKFQQHIRICNMMFVFTSPGAKLDSRFNNDGGPYSRSIL